MYGLGREGLGIPNAIGPRARHMSSCQNDTRFASVRAERIAATNPHTCGVLRESYIARGDGIIDLFGALFFRSCLACCLFQH